MTSSANKTIRPATANQAAVIVDAFLQFVGNDEHNGWSDNYKEVLADLRAAGTGIGHEQAVMEAKNALRAAGRSS